MKVLIWLSFDLGVRGDFEGMYQFLDTYKAKECGDSVGSLVYEYKKDLIGDLTKDLKSFITFDKRSRVYLIFPKAPNNYAGRFIVGRRKSPPWAGHGPSQEPDEEDIGN
jgi:hypothetical protein